MTKNIALCNPLDKLVYRKNVTIFTSVLEGFLKNFGLGAPRTSFFKVPLFPLQRVRARFTKMLSPSVIFKFH